MKEIKIGLTGPIAGGKGEVVKILIDKGFKHTSLSDRIRESLAGQGTEVTRTSMQNEGDRLRLEFGNSVLAARTLELLEGEERGVVIDSIRHPDEVLALKERKVVMIGVTADQRTRFDRVRSRDRGGDPLTFDEFKSADDREIEGDDHRINLGGCLELADCVIENEGTIDELAEKVNGVLENL